MVAFSYLEEHGIDFDREDSGSIWFRSSGARGGRFAIPTAAGLVLDEQVALRPEAAPDYFGYLSPTTGAAEFVVVHNNGRIGGRYRPMLGRLAPSPPVDCEHLATPWPTLDPEVYSSRSTTIPKPEVPVVHVTSPSTGICMELSWASPLGVVFGIPSGGATGYRGFATVKLQLGGAPVAGKVLLESAPALCDRLFYEMDVRNGVGLRLIRREMYGTGLWRGQRHGTCNQVRFPDTVVGREAAQLFAFADSARDNPPLAFLSYYQVLEYFFPYATRRHTINKVRRELHDPTFTGTDSDILGIVSVVEAGVQPSEARQVAMLLEESVRPRRIEEFFAEAGIQEHFGRRGPITGVDFMTFRQPDTGLVEQSANRIYKIRNRIVHAKDDPKFGDARVLLPESAEAYALRPDIELVRLLAIEVITNAQLGG